MRFRAAALAILIAAGCAGGPPTPPTYAAKGKIVYADGAPLAGGVVQFQPENDAGASLVADVGKDGTFTLSTLFNGRRTPGAVAGAFRVLVVPPIGSNQAVHPVQLPGLATVRPQDDNDFTFTIPRPR